MAGDREITERPQGGIESISPAQLVQQVMLIQEAMKSVMKDGQHYGTVPGCGDKPTLLKSGAEKLSLMFRLAPHFDAHGGKVVSVELPNNHREYTVHCALLHIPTGNVWAVGVGSCSTMETKYRFRKSEVICPECGVAAIIKGIKQYGGGWVCYKKKGGCGMKWKDNDPAVLNFKSDRVEYDNPADYYNTCLKMGKKRAYVDAILSATGASDIFTQDIEDLKENGAIKGDIVEGEIVGQKESIKMPEEIQDIKGAPQEQLPLIEQAAAIIGDGGPVVTEYCIDKGYIKPGQTWENCEEKVLNIIVRSKKGWMAQVNAHIDKKNT